MTTDDQEKALKDNMINSHERCRLSRINYACRIHIMHKGGLVAKMLFHMTDSYEYSNIR